MFSFNMDLVLLTKCHSINFQSIVFNLILIIVLFNALVSVVLSESKPIRNVEISSECVFSFPKNDSYVCPPELFDFTPKISGGTIVTISIGNIASRYYLDNYHIHIITIGGTECHIIMTEWQYRRVRCRTNKVKEEFSGKVRVSVEIFDSDFLKGKRESIESSEEFKFLEPQLLGVYPSFGPIEGGTNVTIIGKNLHIGSNRTIYLRGIECKESNNNSTFLNCMSGLLTGNSLPYVLLVIDSIGLMINDKGKYHQLIYNKFMNETINSEIPDLWRKDFIKQFPSLQWNETFEYKPNPKISSYEPKNTIKSGYTNITVTGINLNSVSNPRILVTDFEQIHSESLCRVNPSGTEMICLTPAIRDPIPPPKIKVPIDTQLSFILDGVKNYGLISHMSRLIYFPDPTYYYFEENVTDVYLEEPVLRIDGQYVTSDYPIDIRINESLGIPCNLIQNKTFDAIYCRIQYNDIIFKNDGQKHSVKIKVGKITFSPGSVMFISKSISVGAIMASIFIPFVLITGIIAVILYYLRNKKNITKEKKPIDYTLLQRPDLLPIGYSLDQGPDLENVNYPLIPVRKCEVLEETMNFLHRRGILIARKNITMEHILGQGQFGCVYKGLYSPEKEPEREVALKTLKTVIREEMDVELFLDEGLIMNDFRHQNVLTLIGVSFEENGSPIVVLPFMANGDLRTYIRDEKNNPTVKHLLLFAIDIAKGMDYLSSQKFVHRDLAARNCMLDSNLTAKVADFGLSRDIYEREYYRCDNKKLLPVKWMAPECIVEGIYNAKTDVWSYGVLVWELLTRGLTPYPNFVLCWQIMNYLNQGQRLPQPAFCPQMLYFILLRCWSNDQNHRPTFKVLVKELETLIAKLEKGAKKERVDLGKCNSFINYAVLNTYYDYNEQQSQQAVNNEENLIPIHI